MKKVLTFLFITILVIFLTGIYSWSVRKDQVTNLWYLSDPDWSWPRQTKLVSKTALYDATIDPQGDLHVIWSEYSQKEDQLKFTYGEFGPDGEEINVQIINPNILIKQLQILYAHESLHIFYIVAEKNQTNNLEYIKMSLEGQILKQETLVDGEFIKTQEFLVTAGQNGDFFLTWIDQPEKNQYLLKGLKVNTMAKTELEPIKIYDTDPGGLSDLLVAKNGKSGYHLVWSDYETMIKNRKIYKINYLELDEKGREIGTPEKITSGPILASTMVAEGDQLYLVWNQGDYIEERGDFYAKIRNRGEWSPNQILDNPLAAFNPNLAVDSTGKIHFISRQFNGRYYTLVYQLFEPGFSNGEIKRSWLYPYTIETTDPRLQIDQAGQLHCFWMQQIGAKNLHYANTVYSQGISPLAVAGIDLPLLNQGLKTTIRYIIGWPFANLILYSIVLLMLLVVLGIYIFKSKSPKHVTLKCNLYKSTILLGLFGFGVGYVLYNNPIVSPLYYQLKAINGFTILVSAGALFLYMVVNKLKRGELWTSLFLVSGWAYWILMMAYMLNLPNIDYIVFSPF